MDPLPPLGPVFQDRGDVVGAAYHGTYLETGRQIESGGFCLPERQDESQRMGKGVYFWENSERAAKRWAKKWYGDKSGCVVRATIRLGRHLNMGISEHQEAFKELAGFLRKTQKTKIYESQVYNLMASRWIDSARRIHEWGDQQLLAPDFDEAWTKGPSDTMICVYMVSKIEAPCIVTS
jgi:hypothetical protein